MTDTNELLALIFRETLRQFQDARAQLHADDQRAWEALGKPEGTHDTTNVQRLCAEVEQIKADRDSLLRIIGDSFMNLHIPHSAMAFDGRNLTPHAEESARASEIYRTERDALRADLREAMELLRLARGRFQSYEECDQDYCADGSDHQPRARMDALLAKHKETP